MATKDGFQPDHSPIFLSEHAEETGQPDIRTADIGKARQRAAIWSQILKASIWAIAATAIGIAILSVGDPVALLENLTATWVEKPALQPVADPPAPAIQSFAAALDLPATTSDAPARDEIAAAPEPADENRTEIVQPPAEGLLKEFEAWAANKDTQAEAVPVQPAPVAPVQVVQDAPVQVHREKAPAGPAGTKCASRDPATATSSGKGPGRAKSTGAGCARTRRPRRSGRSRLRRHLGSCKASVALTAASVQLRFVARGHVEEVG